MKSSLRSPVLKVQCSINILTLSFFLLFELIFAITCGMPFLQLIVRCKKNFRNTNYSEIYSKYFKLIANQISLDVLWCWMYCDVLWWWDFSLHFKDNTNIHFLILFHLNYILAFICLRKGFLNICAKCCSFIYSRMYAKTKLLVSFGVFFFIFFFFFFQPRFSGRSKSKYFDWEQTK